jgi:hypothetical protein
MAFLSISELGLCLAKQRYSAWTKNGHFLSKSKQYLELLNEHFETLLSKLSQV